MYYENLPIFRSAMNLAVYIETIVKSFEKYPKRILFGIHKAFQLGHWLNFVKIKPVSLSSKILNLPDTRHQTR